MKRVFDHPPEKLTGKQYWRRLDELSDTPEFRGWLEKEFPAGAAQIEGDEWARRGFLKLMGGSLALGRFRNTRGGVERDFAGGAEQGEGEEGPRRFFLNLGAPSGGLAVFKTPGRDH